MEAYQMRVVDEHRELTEKLTRLQNFLVSSRFSEVPPPEQKRMRSQSAAMETYAEILKQRIEHFPEEVPA